MPALSDEELLSLYYQVGKLEDRIKELENKIEVLDNRTKATILHLANLLTKIQNIQKRGDKNGLGGSR